MGVHPAPPLVRVVPFPLHAPTHAHTRRPKFAILDEATSALDEGAQAQCMALAATAGITCLSVGHRPSLIPLHAVVVVIRPGGQHLTLTPAEAAAEVRLHDSGAVELVGSSGVGPGPGAGAEAAAGVGPREVQAAVEGQPAAAGPVALPPRYTLPPSAVGGGWAVAAAAVASVSAPASAPVGAAPIAACSVSVFVCGGGGAEGGVGGCQPLVWRPKWWGC